MSVSDRRQALGRLGAVLAGLFAIGPLGLLRGGGQPARTGSVESVAGDTNSGRVPSVQVRPAEKAVKRNG